LIARDGLDQFAHVDRLDSSSCGPTAAARAGWAPASTAGRRTSKVLVARLNLRWKNLP
jgi:hypothetical protein